MGVFCPSKAPNTKEQNPIFYESQFNGKFKVKGPLTFGFKIPEIEKENYMKQQLSRLHTYLSLCIRQNSSWLYISYMQYYTAVHGFADQLEWVWLKLRNLNLIHDFK